MVRSTPGISTRPRSAAYGTNQAPQIELPFVERDRQRVVSKGHRAIDEFEGRIGDAVDRVVPGVG